MENYSSEIGKKMRSAVKAKLLELGDGSSGQNFIDDELPDYVMIMVANKRSKQQMITDLDLFLGSKTEQFVTWLHDVLHKLQEVTLPLNAVKKRKASHKEKSPVNTSKDKKSAKRDKTASIKNDGGESPKKGLPNTSAHIVPASITDVVAEEVLSQAKKTLDITADAATHIKKAKQKSSQNTPAARAASPTAKKCKSTNEFDIPTITEISTTASTPNTNNVGSNNSANAVVTGNREKDLEELAKLQRKINVAKKKLRHTGQLNEDDSEEDDDLLKLQEGASSDGMEFDEETTHDKEKKAEQPPAKPKQRSPIVFDKTDRDEKSEDQSKPRETISEANSYHRSHSSHEAERRQPEKISFRSPERERERSRSDRRGSENNARNERGNEPPRRSVKDRLGLRSHVSPEPIKMPERKPRREKELYVPAYRRREHDDRHESRDRGRRDDDPRSRFQIEQPSSRNRSRDRSPRNSSRVRRSFSRTSRSRERSPEQRKEIEKRSRSSSVRVSSRVIVAPARPAERSDDEEPIDKPVNSVIKIKPRPHVSPSRQACKKLLLRAVAEAQRSTLIRNSGSSKAKRLPVSSRLGEIVDDDSGDEINDLICEDYNESFSVELEEQQKLRLSYKEQIQKHIRNRSRSDDRMGKGIPSKLLYKRKKENFIVEIEGDMSERKRYRKSHEAADSEEESLVNDAEANNVYEANNSNAEEVDDDAGVSLEKTQFVVTLNDERAPQKYKKSMDSQSRSNNSQSHSPLPHVSSGAHKKGSAGDESLSASNTHMSRSRVREPARRGDLRARLGTRYKSETADSPSVSAPVASSISSRFKESTRDSAHSSSASNGTPPSSVVRQRSEQRKSHSVYMDIYRSKTKDVKKLIIKNDTDEEEEEEEVSSPRKRNDSDLKYTSQTGRSTTPPLSLLKSSTNPEVNSQKSNCKAEPRDSRSPRPTRSSRHIPITYNLDSKENKSDNINTRRRSPSRDRSRRSRTPRLRSPRMRSRSPRDRNAGDRSRSRNSPNESGHRRHRSLSRDRSSRSPTRDKSAGGMDFSSAGESHGNDERRRVRLSEAKKYDNIPDLNSVALDSNALRNMKPKERCKYHPNCTKSFCEFYHPTAPCKSFPNCRYADKCLYSHPKCKFDLACTNADCNFSHSGPRNPSQLVLAAPPLSSSVVPVQNYKSISATNLATPSGLTMCKYFPNCTKIGCTFFHPKPCRFGKNCINKLECNFYHADMQSSNKFKWIAAAT